MFDTLEKFGSKYVPLAFTSIGKRMVAYPRFLAQLRQSKQEVEQYEGKYPQQTLFVAGMPKSGSTWLKKMLCTIPGFANVMIPEAVYYDEKTGVSYNYDFPADTFDRLEGGLCVLKLHSHGSDSNFKILKDNNIKHVALYRDLRDVAVSYLYYVKRTRHNIQHKEHAHLSEKEVLMKFGHDFIGKFAGWVDSWYRHKDDPLCYVVSYEQLKANPDKHIREILEHYGIQADEKLVRQVVDQNSFKNLSGGRKPGEEKGKSFFRKGISGDWKNHFDDEVIALYKKEMGDFLEKYYPDNADW